MFGQVPETQYDLHFSMLGIPVRVHPAFFVVWAALGWNPRAAMALETNVVTLILLWTGLAFVSILIHELGHAVLAQIFGWPPRIVLYHFGGLAMYNPTFGHTRGRSIAISLAGPGAQFVLAAAIWALWQFLVERNVAITPLTQYALFQMIWINIAWPVLNLLPIYPLDGGQVAEQIISAFNPYRGREWTFKLGIAVSVFGAILLFYLRQAGILYTEFGPVLLLFLAFNNYQLLQIHSGRGGMW